MPFPSLINGPYDIGMVTWAPGGQLGNVTPEIATGNNRVGYDITITANDLSFIQERGKVETKYGLTEEKRREIYKKQIAAGTRATDEAQAKYANNPTQYIKIQNQLSERYNGQIRKQYGLTAEQYDAIGTEGLHKHWPMPEG